MRTPTVILALALCVTCTMAEDKAAEPLKAVSEGTGHFATNFFKQVSAENKGKNLISSPLSAHVVLSMAAFGAGGNTAVQMRQSLHMPADDVVSKQGFENLIDTLNNVENVTLEVANKMYLANNLKLKSDYKSLTSGTFRSEATEIDTSKPAESAKVVNDWVDERTHHKIKDIVKEDDITSDTRMLLLNAVYFKGKWAKEFKKEGTQDKIFHVDAKTEKKVPTMFASGSYVYGELPDLKAKFVELPYENKDLKMVIIVPDEIEGLSAIQENLESFNHTRLAEAGSEREVQLYIPKFKIESTIDLKKPLEALGMTDMFSNAANFTGISDEPLKVGKVLQKAFIEVNEEGSEAAAVTVIKIRPVSALLYEEEPTIINVDRPFAFGIFYHNTKTILFSGYIVNPTA
ncbi:alaserpin isoform X5 [Nasonia vitripennis]|uniref:Serpin domain-containing protein n=1 Tax=Nasonia vitripennis TaxID=7425 RepID=A0A7M7H0N4_NASVI|nr:alaserpin isoform X5 [Nasonia vitripennis]